MSRQTVVKTVLVDTLEIGYEESGPANSNPVILLHGFPDDARAWDGVAGPLVAEGEERRSIPSDRVPERLADLIALYHRSGIELVQNRADKGRSFGSLWKPEGQPRRPKLSRRQESHAKE